MKIWQLKKLQKLYLKIAKLESSKNELIGLETFLQNCAEKLSFEDAVENVFKITVGDLLAEIERSRSEISDSIRSIYREIKNVDKDEKDDTKKTYTRGPYKKRRKVAKNQK